MLSELHEVLVDAFRRRPELLLVLLPGVRQAPVPAHDRARTDDPDAVAILPVPWRADLLVVFEQAGAATLAVILEVQLARDDNKRRSWLNYVTAAAARYDCDVWLMVLAPDDAVARWAARPIRTGHPGEEEVLSAELGAGSGRLSGHCSCPSGSRGTIEGHRRA
ncbi:MAG: hypothetical protein HYV63_11600 [Candidatus Schekmanbacteria bacterium]|nr:hypothetical protein [Candidatus Schekmanbacteria bacterium]